MVYMVCVLGMFSVTISPFLCSLFVLPYSLFHLRSSPLALIPLVPGCQALLFAVDWVSTIRILIFDLASLGLVDWENRRYGQDRVPKAEGMPILM